MNESQEAVRLVASLARSGDADQDAAQIAETVGAAWRGIDAALTPLIGHRGVAALQTRSLHVAGKTHPWLKGALDGAPPAPNAANIDAVLRAQTPAHAAAGGAAFLHTFHDLLASLVGPSLTERLLRSIWIRFLNAPPAQDTSP